MTVGLEDESVEDEGVPSESRSDEREEREELGELLKYTSIGYLLGLLAGVVFDQLGLQRSGLGQWLVRTLSGESESVFEGLFALRKRLARAAGTMAEAYGWGKVLGMTAPWAVDAASRLLGVDVYGAAGFYIPYLYAMSDQIGANVSGFLFLRKKHGSISAGGRAYLRDPLMLTSMIVVAAVPLGLLAARLAGFTPSTQVYTALETMAANLCWLPPLVAWLWEKKRDKA